MLSKMVELDGYGWIREHSYRNVAWNGCMEDMRRQDDGCPVSNIQETSNKDADGCGWIREHSYRKVAWNGCMEDMGRQDDMSCLQYPGNK